MSEKTFEYQSIPFTGLRKWLFYIIVLLSALFLVLFFALVFISLFTDYLDTEFKELFIQTLLPKGVVAEIFFSGQLLRAALALSTFAIFFYWVAIWYAMRKENKGVKSKLQDDIWALITASIFYTIFHFPTEEGIFIYLIGEAIHYFILFYIIGPLLNEMIEIQQSNK